MTSTLKVFSIVAVLCLNTLSARATCGGGGGGGRGGIAPSGQTEQQVYFVPWKVVGGQSPAVAADSQFTLYWFPASVDDAQKSELRTSRPLTLYAAQCIAMAVIPAENTELASKYGSAGKLPLAVLAGKDGVEVARAEGSSGSLRVGDVEKMVRNALHDQGQAIDRELDSAKAGSANDRDGAIASYRSILARRCSFPKQGREAFKRLKKLGVSDISEGPEVGPNFDGVVTAKITRLMQAGLVDELAGRYEKARRRYVAAASLDAGDPVPLRYLGELYRHQTGEWTKASDTFRRVLAMHADPLSRAVALHGLGKITIHEGRYLEGLGMFEDSLREFPMALTYRNLAVYWNSEGKLLKAETYLRKAMELEPKDPYNIIFAATYLAADGKTAEALKIARENESSLPASYNLAAIYAMSGETDKALALLKRHFYRYERYDGVRAMEMMEARVDIVFSSLRQDPRFLELTKLAR